MTLQICSHHTQTRRFVFHMARQSMSYRLLTVFMFLASFAVVAFGNMSPIQATAQSQQHSWVGDVPIMADLSVEPALGFAFDSPNGRIVMIFASSRQMQRIFFGFTMNR